MVKRPVKASFGAVYVFPGGVVDDNDKEVRGACSGMPEADADQLLALKDGGLDYFIAAIRELFEETGVLLADGDVVVDELESARAGLNSNSISWPNFVAGNALRLRCDQLHYFGHWITPDAYAKRYSTRFFVAEIPEGQVANHDEGELTASAWITARDALRPEGEEGLPLHFPTVKNLEEIAKHDSMDSLIAWANRCAIQGVVAVSPLVPGGNPNATPVMPDSAGSA